MKRRYEVIGSVCVIEENCAWAYDRMIVCAVERS